MQTFMFNSHYLSPLFAPSAVAVIGASEQEQSVGRVIFRNLLDAGFRGALYAVNPKYQEVFDQPCVATIEEVGRRVDLAIVAVPPRALELVIEQCARSGVRNAVIVTAADETGAGQSARLLETARAGGMRLLGPGSLGIAAPHHGLNAALSKIAIQTGDLALVSQSGAMCSVVLDWASAHQIGFSAVVTVSDSIDLAIGELLDYLIQDPHTRYILLYVDHVAEARHFMSALRSAARIKPIIVLKGGRRDQAGEVSRADAVFDAALRRAGVVRVQNIGQLFFAARALASGFRPRVEQLAIVTNGAGPAAMAADRAGDLGTPLVSLAEGTQAALQKIRAQARQCFNPLDLGGDARPEDYRAAILALAADPAVANVLVILSPHALTDPLDVAQVVIEVLDQVNLTLCCCWMGGGQIAEARRRLEAAGVPVFGTPEAAIELFHNISGFYRNQALLLQAAGHADGGLAAGDNARTLIQALLGQRRTRLSAMEAKALLRGFGVPVTQSIAAADATAALCAAGQIGYPVVMKVDADGLDYKSPAGGVRLNLTNAEAVWNAFHDVVSTVRARAPQATVRGVSIEPYLHRPHARELVLSVFRDEAFGPVISLAPAASQGDVGTRTLALPPLNEVLVRDLLAAEPLQRVLGSFHDLPDVNRVALEHVLLAVSDLCCELPWLRELEIDPLLIDYRDAIAVDAHIVIDQGLPAGSDRYAHMAIHPYPAYLSEEWTMSDGRLVMVRAVEPDDARRLEIFFGGLSTETRFMRFMEEIDELPASLIARFTQIDYDRELEMVELAEEEGETRMIGVARFSLALDGESVEFALVVADTWQRYGRGRRLMARLIDTARARGYRNIIGDVLGKNRKMLGLMRALGFEIHAHPEESGLKRVIKPLQG